MPPDLLGKSSTYVSCPRDLSPTRPRPYPPVPPWASGLFAEQITGVRHSFTWWLIVINVVCTFTLWLLFFWLAFRLLPLKGRRTRVRVSLN